VPCPIGRKGLLPPSRYACSLSFILYPETQWKTASLHDLSFDVGELRTAG
jgi:hypothetical protein